MGSHQGRAEIGAKEGRESVLEMLGCERPAAEEDGRKAMIWGGRRGWSARDRPDTWRAELGPGLGASPGCWSRLCFAGGLSNKPAFSKMGMWG